jgi:DNA-directed RNA polymerase specialized sigma24 family protein
VRQYSVSVLSSVALDALDLRGKRIRFALWRRVLRLRRLLSDLLRLPLLLKYIEGCSEKEAAQAIGIPVTTFKNRLHRARTELRKALDREVMFE